MLLLVPDDFFLGFNNSNFEGKGKEKTVDTGASLCTKLVFFVLLVSFALTSSLFLLDYKQGQLQELKAQLPPEVHDVLDKAAKMAGDLTAKIKEFNAQALVKIQELSSQVPVGDKTLADILFTGKKANVSTSSWKLLILLIMIF